MRQLAGPAPERLKFVDESACHLGLTRAYGWAKAGARCCFAAPANTGKRRTVVGLLALGAGLGAHRVQAGSLKAADFEAFVREQVAPGLAPGDVLILDNARCHQGKPVREAVEAAGARLLFLPPYSPDFSPIELAWRKVKARLRQAGARTAEALLEAVEDAVRAVTPEDATKFYAHCGYAEAEEQHH